MNAFSFEFTLLDDGTLDTVVQVHCPNCENTWEERFSGEYAKYFRDPDSGTLDEDAFFADLREGHDLYCDCDTE